MPWTTRFRNRSVRPRWRMPGPVRAEKPRKTSWAWRLVRSTVAAGSIAGLGWLVLARMQELPKVEPPFERIVGAGAGPVKEFALRDADGRVHTAAEWAGRPAAVLVFLAPDCPVSRDYADELESLAREFGPRGIVFFGIDPTTSPATDQAAKAWAGWRLPFPVVFDPARRVVRQAGVEVTPQAVVILPDGQVIYRGRIDDQYAADGQKLRWPGRSDLKAALDAILANEMPDLNDVAAHGTPLSPIATSAGDPAEAITFNKHVAPILWNNCARCHRPGNVGPFPLLSYRDAAKRADFIREVTAGDEMPPWKAHPGAGVFLDAPRLTVLEKEVLARWAETGCAEGNPRDLPAMPRFSDGWALGPPDLVLTMPEAWELPPSEFDTYRAFAVPVPLDHEVTITGLEFQPGNRRIVHHSRVHLDSTGDARRREQDDPTPGFAGWMGRKIVELPYPGLGGWTPGMTPRFAPEGSGRLVPRGSEIVFQIHYHPTGKVESDRSRVGLYFARKPVTRPMAGLTISTDRIDIPAGEKRYTLIQAARLKADVKLYTVVPHAHYLCREFRLAATLPDGTIRPLLWIKDWDFDWQDQYRYARPVRLPKGTVLTFAAYFDNSADNPHNPNKPPRRVRYGIESRDEMCACHLEFLPEDPGGYAAYPSKSPFGL
jgi:peroxiredoxin